MAWKSTEEQALNLIGQHMGVMKDDNKEELSGLYSRLIFPERQEEWSMERGNAWDLVKWTTLEGVTFVTTWDNDHLFNNLRYAMIQESMGKGPSQYCIINSADPSFESKILLLANYLPQEKMCIHPPRENFESTLAIEYWKDLGTAICSRQLYLEHPITRTIFYTQQFVLYLRSGKYGPPYWG